VDGAEVHRAGGKIPVRADFCVNGVRVAPGERKVIDIPVAQLYTHTPLYLPVQVIHGRREGPVLMVCAAIHGDELNGVEIIRRLLAMPSLRNFRGTLVAVPIVNVFGFIQQTRCLPDRRDLNRCFPGSEKGSLGARIAHLFKTEIIDKSTHIIDLHTGSMHRSNLPQIRACLDLPATEAMARAFGVPVILNAALRDGSMRSVAEAAGIPVITYEAGEALRFDELSIQAGVKGVVSVMRQLEMLPRAKRTQTVATPLIAKNSNWVRAESDGIMRPLVELGSRVRRGDPLAEISDPFGANESKVISPYNGIVIGQVNIPLVNEGEALFHIARFQEIDEAEKQVQEFTADILQD
jgi:uncharacterized protein